MGFLEEDQQNLDNPRKEESELKKTEVGHGFSPILTGIVKLEACYICIFRVINNYASVNYTVNLVILYEFILMSFVLFKMFQVK